MPFVLRPATADDLPVLLPRIKALNALESIEISDADLGAALARLLADPDLGAAWIVESDDVPIGYAVVTFGYDLEFGGRDAYLTELWIDDAHRNTGAGSATLAAIADALRALDVRALHLGVRPENPAVRLYERAGFQLSPRLLMTRRL